MKTNQNPIIAILGVKGAGKDTYFNNVKKQKCCSNHVCRDIKKKWHRCSFLTWILKIVLLKKQNVNSILWKLTPLFDAGHWIFQKNELSNWQP